MSKIDVQSTIGSSIVKRLIPSFLDTEVRDYGLYVLHTRALPNIMDGMRVGARKILYATIINKKINPKDKSIKDNPSIKMLSLIGRTMDLKWGHGNASLKNTIEQLGKVQYNKFSPLGLVGQYGTLRDSSVNTAARYLSVRRTRFLKIFEHSSKLWNLKIEEGEKVEPDYMLPIVPVTLLYRTSAPGYGYSFNCFSYDIDDIINAMMNSINLGTCRELNWSFIEPTIDGIKQSNIIYNHKIDAYFNVGEYMLLTKDTIVIKDLTYNWDYEKYEKYLDSIQERGLIRSWKNLTKGNDTNFHITFPPGRMTHLVKQKLKFFQLLRLYKKIPKDKLNLIDIDGKAIINFTNVRDLIDGFVRRRLDVYTKFKKYQIDLLSEQIKLLKEKIDFIQLIIDEKIEIRRKSKDNILYQCSQRGYDFTDTIDELLKLPIKRLTQEEIDKAALLLENLNTELNYYMNTSTKHLYINDLIKFKQEFTDTKIREINVTK